MCIDLSRCVNKVIKAPKFKIESTIAALQVIERGDYCFSFNLKSAYLQVKLNENFCSILGLPWIWRTGPGNISNILTCLLDTMTLAES